MPKIKILDTEGRWNDRNEDEYLWWPRVIWIDPGVVSGVAVVWFDPKALLVDDKTTPKVLLAYSEIFLSGPENGTRGQIKQYLALRQKLDEEIGLATGCESFVPRQVNYDPAFLSPVRIRAGLDLELSNTRPHGASHIGEGVPLFVQSPSDAINAFSNDRLKALRMYREGRDHVNDAKRHALLWIRRLKESSRGIEFFKQAHGNEEGWWD